MWALATRHRGAMLLLMLNIFLAFMGIGLVIPIMPTYMNMLGVSGTVVGLLVAVFALTQLIVSPYAGSWADRYGRKWIIVIGMFLFAVSELIFGLANTTVVLFLARMLGGVAAAFIMPAVMAYVVDITTDQDRGMGMGWISAAISTGFIIGPAIGGFLAEYGIRVPFFAAAGAAALTMLVSMLVLPESLSEEQRQKARQRVVKRESQLKTLIQSYKTPYFTGLIIILITSLGLAQYETVIGLFVDHKYGYTPKDIAWMVLIGATVGAALQLTLFGWLINKIGEKKLVVFCLLIIAVFMVATIFSHTYFLMIVSVTMVFLAVDFVRPAVSTLFSRTAGNDQGLVAGLNASFTSLGNIIGPTLAGIFFDVQINSPFFVGSMIILIGWFVSMRWRDRKISVAN